MSTVGTTLLAAANVGRADGAAPRGTPALFDKLTIGQNLKLQVIRHLEQQRYEVAFGGRRHVVESRVSLEAGTQIQARVEAKGDQLELRYLSTEARFADEELAETETSLATPDAEAATVPQWLGELAAQYRVPLDAAAAKSIERSAAQVANPELMTRAGLFLQKFAQSHAARDLEALYGALDPHAGVAAGSLAMSALAIKLSDLQAGGEIAATLDKAFDAAGNHSEATTADVTGDGGSDEQGQDPRRALQLLNLQDEGSVAWRYGTLPLLVGGRLIELDLVLFRERDSHAARGGLKRLVMTLDTTHLGRVHV